MKKTTILLYLLIAGLLFSLTRFQTARMNVLHSKYDYFDSTLERYNKDLSSHTEQFINWMEKKDVTLREHLSPASLCNFETLHECRAQLEEAEDSVYTYLYESIQISNRYGNELMAMVARARTETSFVELWKHYEYKRLESIKKFADHYASVADLYEFLQVNYYHYMISEDGILFDNDSTLNTYRTMLVEISNVQMDAMSVRNEPVHNPYFDEAIALAWKGL